MFRVWSPIHKKVELLIGGRKILMHAEADGWWSADVSDPADGDYGFMLDGEGPFPDPRSPWQPNGIHGLSRVVDHDAFVWRDAGWNPPPLSSAIIYELHIGTFTPEGTFDAAIGKLEHLRGLGITHVEIMPVNEFSGSRNWGYDGVDLFAPHHVYGGPDGLKRLVNACHDRGFAVILDVVYNHLGPTGNYLEKFGPYFRDCYPVPWGKALNFDGPDSAEVRRFFCDNALMWLRDYHCDALRLDAVHAIFDFSAEHFLEQLGAEVKLLENRMGRHLALIAESDLNDPRLLWPRERGGFALAAQWSDDFHHALHSVLSGERNGYYADFGTIGDLCHALREVFVYDGRYSRFRKRRHGRRPEGLGGDRFLGYLQNHDQIGNRARGERSSQLMNTGRLKIGAALVLLSPFVPMLFQGEEWGASTPFLFFTDHQEPELGRAVTEGRRREFEAFGWNPADIADPQSLETFERSRLNWGELSRSPHDDLLRWHRELIRLRRSEPDLSDSRRDLLRAHYDEETRWLAIERGAFSIVCNLGTLPHLVPIQPGLREVVMASEKIQNPAGGKVILPADSVAILKSSAGKEHLGLHS